MNDHLQAYLRRTTAHGFNHLVRVKGTPKIQNSWHLVCAGRSKNVPLQMLHLQSKRILIRLCRILVLRSLQPGKAGLDHAHHSIVHSLWIVGCRISYGHP